MKLDAFPDALKLNSSFLDKACSGRNREVIYFRMEIKRMRFSYIRFFKTRKRTNLVNGNLIGNCIFHHLKLRSPQLMEF